LIPEARALTAQNTVPITCIFLTDLRESFGSGNGAPIRWLSSKTIPISMLWQTVALTQVDRFDGHVEPNGVTAATLFVNANAWV
jgi:hypothetical protein